MRELRRRSPTILVLEDAHWADDATLELLRLIARRVRSLPAALLVSYRQTELSRFHPLRQVLGEFGSEASSVRLTLEFAPAAGARASEVGAHREAAAQYARTLRFADGLPLAERAELLGRHTLECYVTTQDEAALASSREALDAWRQLREPLKEAEALANVARVALNMGFTGDATEAAREAAAVLEELAPGPHLARVYDLIRAASLLGEDRAETERLSRRAVEIAEQVEDRYTVVSALSILGAASALQGVPSGVEELERALALAQDLRDGEDLVGRCYVLLAMGGCRAQSLDLMERSVEPGLAYCEERDLDVWARILLATRSWVALERGAWDRAAETVELVLMEDCTLSCLQARVVLALLRARRGDPDPWTPLAEARGVAERTGQLWWTWQIAAAEAEALWLAGRREAIADATADTFDLAIRLGSPWVVGELAWWRRQGGVREPVPAEAGGPFEQQLRGDWSGAEAAWRDAGCPYEAALALAESGDEAALRKALEELQQLGARPAGAIIARRLRVRGVLGVSRSHPGTRARSSA